MLTPLDHVEEAHHRGDARARRGRTKHSGWYITINTNQRPRPRGDPLLEEFHRAILSMVDEIGLTYILEFQDDYQPGEPWRGVPNQAAYYTQTVRSDARVVTEIGPDPRGRRVHGHILLAIKHNTNVRLSRNAIESWIMDRIHSRDLRSRGGLHIHWKRVGYTEDLERYLEKYKEPGYDFNHYSPFPIPPRPSLFPSYV